jgi:hypothetical protein
MDVVVKVVESKKDEIFEKAVEQINEKKVDEVVDKVEETVEKVIDEVAKKIEETAAPVAAILDKLDDNPQVAKVIDILEDQLDGREISCSCFGWLVALRIARKSKKTSPPKPEADQKTTVVLPALDSPAKESPPPTTPQPKSE